VVSARLENVTDEFRQLEDDMLRPGRANSVIMELARNL